MQSYTDPGLKAQSERLNQYANNVQLGYSGDAAQKEDEQIRAGRGAELGEMATLDQDTAAQMKDVDRSFSLGERALGIGGGSGGAIALANSQEKAKGDIRANASRVKGAAITGLHRNLMDTYQNALNAQRGTQVAALGGGTQALSAGTNIYDANKRSGGILGPLLGAAGQVGAAFAGGG